MKLLVSLLFLMQDPADPARFFDYDAAAPIDFRSSSEEVVEEVIVEDVSYNSARKGRVPAYLVRPRGDGPFAGILYMHWGQGDRTEFLSEAVRMAKAGALSLLIDAPYNRSDVESFAFVAQPEAERDGYIQLVADIRKGIDLLSARKDVDPKRLGYVGHSLGATWGGPLAALEKRISAFVLMGGLPIITDVFGDDSFSQLLQKSFTREQLEHFVKVMEPINPDRLVGRAAPGSILFQFARHDRFISDAAAKAYVKAAGDSHEVRSYFTSHEFNDPDSPRDRFEFLKKKLHLSP